MKKLVLFVVLGLLALPGCRNKPEKTIANLQSSVVNEATASVRYNAFAAKAREEGYESIARLFEASARSERVHAERYKEFLDALNQQLNPFQPTFNLKSTVENLSFSIDLERREINVVYPKYQTDALSESMDEVAETMGWSITAEKKHLGYLEQALDYLKNRPDSLIYLPGGYSVCPMCGNTFDNLHLPKECSNCLTSSDMFINL